MKKFRIGAEKRNILEGYIFVLPFILGTLIFFAFPLYMSIKLSFGKLQRIEGFIIRWIGFGNYLKAFITDTKFIPMFVGVFRHTLIKAPLTIIFALIIAILINKNVKFRGFFRTVFFIPFLLGMGEVMKQLLGQGVDRQVVSISGGRLLPRELLMYLGPKVVEAIDSFFGIIIVVLWGSGVQILLFLSGLQSIPASLYESSKVDGATEWEMFWKITFPMISPILLLNIVYTLIASFTDITNPILEYIQNLAFKGMEFEYAATIGWIYFVFIIILVMLVFILLRNYVYTTDAKEAKRNDRRSSY
ncbi:MAG TPA: sugar ABC transporter permease [Clostridiales bacterium]|nr:sugar ABC transporter permease [Clostridiales bacterium]